jgi:two-component system nitrate/nitrite response regulator NarL
VVILAPAYKAEDVVAALRAGACGFLSQDVLGETLLGSLELITQGEMIVHPQFAWDERSEEYEEANGDCRSVVAGSRSHLASRRQSAPLRVDSAETTSNDCVTSVPSLSRREMLILRMLMQGASNKVIARNLVITESTVKVHMKAILRKLRLQNRTQAAIWARNHVQESDLNNSVGTDATH